MQKLFTFLFFGLITFSACHSTKEKSQSPSKDSKEKETFFPVTDFLKGQLKELSSMPVTPLKTISINGKTDSVWVKRENVLQFARPFLTPEVDSVSMTDYFSEKSFLDQTINAVTFSYDPKIKLPDSIKLRHWDVYIDPQKGTVQRIYLVKENISGDSDITTQLTWKVNEWCSIRTITQRPGKKPQIQEEKMTWNFDN